MWCIGTVLKILKISAQEKLRLINNTYIHWANPDSISIEGTTARTYKKVCPWGGTSLFVYQESQCPPILCKTQSDITNSADIIVNINTLHNIM